MLGGAGFMHIGNKMETESVLDNLLYIPRLLNLQVYESIHERRYEHASVSLRYGSHDRASEGHFAQKSISAQNYPTDPRAGNPQYNLNNRVGGMELSALGRVSRKLSALSRGDAWQLVRVTPRSSSH
jgi:hypothetical protein